MESASLFEQLRNIDGLDISTGLANVGGYEEAFVEVMRVFVTDFTKQLDALKGSFNSEDWPSYYIHIHGLKGAFANIGARNLAQQSLNLELASRAGDSEFCKRKHQGVIDSMSSFYDALYGLPFFETQKPEEPAAPNPSKKAILAVDDMSTSLVTLKVILQNDFKVLTAESAAAAEEILNNNHVDLMLLDIEMPGMTGFEYLGQLQKDPEKKKVPVIFVTSHADPQFINKALSSGVGGYVVKPFVPHVLIKRIKATLDIPN
jgi:CheY-like chemotaxis protein/HPt (histidine-containing phosphotransfer) domain-containing protein